MQVIAEHTETRASPSNGTNSAARALEQVFNPPNNAGGLINTPYGRPAALLTENNYGRLCRHGGGSQDWVGSSADDVRW